ncbi:hypothetical protein FB565_001909 [Actinoplanes lutulentus]|uniref:Uncharacterized protein n=1 Tax=Actinoplanes lutulentus TaxID=1287878 RepID=A0A327Z066_9ACTN|nr:hypothetical protein [Actinoplanes lutulentus]MBB2942196.1 hypothetical protein [Actinoplanes lutulentus]RAK26850.1 hypothetical protein B0I29_1254 [Actinoplanes lutulentus]
MSDDTTELTERAAVDALVVRLRTIEQQRDAWRTRFEGMAGERDTERETVRKIRASGSYRLGRTLVSFARNPLHSSRRIVRKVRRKPAKPASRKKVPATPLPTHLYVAIGLDLDALRDFVLAVRRRLLVETDHRAVVLTDEPAFSLLRKAGLILEYLPDRVTWEKHRPDRPWDGVLAERLANLSRDHGAAQVIFVDPDAPPNLPDLLSEIDTTPPVHVSLPQS